LWLGADSSRPYSIAITHAKKVTEFVKKSIPFSKCQNFIPSRKQKSCPSKSYNNKHHSSHNFNSLVLVRTTTTFYHKNTTGEQFINFNYFFFHEKLLSTTFCLDLKNKLFSSNKKTPSIYHYSTHMSDKL